MDSFRSAFVLYTGIGALIVAGFFLLPANTPTYDVEALKERFTPKVVASEVVLREPFESRARKTNASNPSDRWLQTSQPKPTATSRPHRATSDSADVPTESISSSRSATVDELRASLAESRSPDVRVRGWKTNVRKLTARVLKMCELSTDRDLCWDEDGRPDALLADAMRRAFERRAPGALESAARWVVVEDDLGLAQEGGEWIVPTSDPEEPLLRPAYSGDLVGLNSTSTRMQIVPLNDDLRLQYVLPETTLTTQIPLEIGAESTLDGAKMRLVAVDELEADPPQSRVRLELDSGSKQRVEWSVEWMGKAGTSILAVDPTGQPASSGILDLANITTRRFSSITQLTIDTPVSLDAVRGLKISAKAGMRIEFSNLRSSPSSP